MIIRSSTSLAHASGSIQPVPRLVMEGGQHMKRLRHHRQHEYYWSVELDIPRSQSTVF